MPIRSNTRLQWGKNFSLSRTPQIQPTDASPSALIIGGGVTGLITAWVLLDRGYYVTVLSKEWASYTKEQRLTSQIAGALWEYPPAACGQHTDAISQKHSKGWCMVAYRVWEAIAASPKLSAEAGVRMRESSFFFPCPVEEDETQLSKMNEIMRSGVRGFRRDPNLMERFDIDPTYGAVDAYQHLAPIIDTDRCMTWLMGMVQSKGARFLTETIHGDLFTQEDELRERFGADVIVNCTGLAGAEIAGDNTCYPIRGCLIRVINDGTDFPKVKSALTIPADAIHDSNEIVFIVPRNDNILLLGGIAQSAARALQRLAADGRQHRGRLLSSHDRGSGVRPLKQKPRCIRAAAHCVVPCAETAADHHGVFRHRRTSDRRDELGTVLGDAAGLRRLAHHEAADVLQKHERYAVAAA